MVGRKKTAYTDSYHFSDVGIDTPFAKAEPATSELYPEAIQSVFISEWHALQYIRRMRRLYNRHPAIASHRGNKRKVHMRTRQINRESDERFRQELQKEMDDADREDSAHDETFALAP
jgi:hypothetical protein